MAIEHRTFNPADPGSRPGRRTNARPVNPWQDALEQSRWSGVALADIPCPIRLVAGRLVLRRPSLAGALRATLHASKIAPDDFVNQEQQLNSAMGHQIRVPTGVAVAKRLTRWDVAPVTMGLNPIGHPCGYSKLDR